MAERSCECYQWRELLDDPFFPVWLNPKMNEYVLISGKRAEDSVVIYYCPTCGGRMSKSRQREFFTIPSDEDLAEARAILQHITDAISMRSILGEPNEMFDWWTDESGELIPYYSGVPTFKRQYRYSSRWKTLQVTIQEFEDGNLTFAFYGQPSGSDKL